MFSGLNFEAVAGTILFQAQVFSSRIYNGCYIYCSPLNVLIVFQMGRLFLLFFFLIIALKTGEIARNILP